MRRRPQSDTHSEMATQVFIEKRFFRRSYGWHNRSRYAYSTRYGIRTIGRCIAQCWTVHGILSYACVLCIWYVQAYIGRNIIGGQCYDIEIGANLCHHSAIGYGSSVGDKFNCSRRRPGNVYAKSSCNSCRIRMWYTSCKCKPCKQFTRFSFRFVFQNKFLIFR